MLEAPRTHNEGERSCCCVSAARECFHWDQVASISSPLWTYCLYACSWTRAMNQAVCHFSVITWLAFPGMVFDTLRRFYFRHYCFGWRFEEDLRFWCSQFYLLYHICALAIPSGRGFVNLCWRCWGTWPHFGRPTMAARRKYLLEVGARAYRSTAQFTFSL